jgi:hypothetical protein
VLTFIAAAALAFSSPPAAHLALGSASAPLAISSYCWRSHCGAPLAASTRVAVVPRGYLVQCDLGFTPTQATLTVGGRKATVTLDGPAVTWHAQWAGGITLRVQSSSGWVVYVGRIALRHT